MSEEVKATEGAEKNQQGQDEKITLTQSEFETKLQSETDKRVQQALKTQAEKIKTEHGEQLKQARADAERMALMSAEEKQKELDKKRTEELAERERNLTMKEIQLKAINKLDTDGLPVSFADFLLSDKEEKTFDNIDIFKKHWQTALDAAVKERIKGITPSGGEQNKTFDMNAEIRKRMRR